MTDAWEPITIPAASLASLLYNIRASLDDLPNGISKAMGVGSLDVLEEYLTDDGAIMRGYHAVQKMLRFRVSNQHDHAEAFRRALVDSPAAATSVRPQADAPEDGAA